MLKTKFTQNDASAGSRSMMGSRDFGKRSQIKLIGNLTWLCYAPSFARLSEAQRPVMGQNKEHIKKLELDRGQGEEETFITTYKTTRKSRMARMAFMGALPVRSESLNPHS